MTSDAEAAAELPNAVFLHAHALFVYRLLPSPELQTKTASIQRHAEATSMPWKIISLQMRVAWRSEYQMAMRSTTARLLPLPTFSH
jgi:hypothetical protein